MNANIQWTGRREDTIFKDNHASSCRDCSLPFTENKGYYCTSDPHESVRFANHVLGNLKPL